ncbi:DUF4405 domain-containing protein [Methanolobus vulcani]|uniref:DUF4405 domain-containing protein n=1 Tax=Methanolobus vulcani TaxID=38026 RepID=A0A7Z8KNF2_9EURY|nr:DUF4405 domain-containing protein [Methanolobus vulcani]TQD25371.1 DUF4405 domain-containing protein [Methanolobus vulcani]
MKKSDIKFLNEALMFLFLSILAGIGLLMRFSFGEHGTESHSAGEELVLGFGDSVWGTIHLYVGLTLVILIVIHIYLHFSAIQSMYSKFITNPQKRKIVGVTYILICLVAFFLFIVAKSVGH